MTCSCVHDVFRTYLDLFKTFSHFCTIFWWLLSLFMICLFENYFFLSYSQLVFYLFITFSFETYFFITCSHFVNNLFMFWSKLLHDMFTTSSFSQLIHNLFRPRSQLVHDLLMSCSQFLPSSAPAPTPAKLGWVGIIPTWSVRRPSTQNSSFGSPIEA